MQIHQKKPRKQDISIVGLLPDKKLNEFCDYKYISILLWFIEYYGKVTKELFKVKMCEIIFCIIYLRF